MDLLLARRGREVQISEKVLIAAAGNIQIGAEVMDLLLSPGGHGIKVTEGVLKAPAGNPWSGGCCVHIQIGEGFGSQSFKLRK